MAWKQGQSGNPNGRGKDKLWRDALVMALAEYGPDHKALRRIADKCIKDAMSGDRDARREIAERIDGKVPQEQQHSGGDTPIELNHVIERRIIKDNESNDEGA